MYRITLLLALDDFGKWPRLKSELFIDFDERIDRAVMVATY